jgi:hypothetical protein
MHMKRAHFALAATAVSTMMYAGVALSAQATQAPPMQSVLAGKKFTPPVRGEAVVEYTDPVTKRLPGKDIVQTTIKVRNQSAGPIARLQIDIPWYDKGGEVVTTGRGVVNGLLQPGEIQTIVVETPYNAKMLSNNYVFKHANGTVKPAKVKSLEAPKDAAAPAGAAKKAPAAAKK